MTLESDGSWTDLGSGRVVAFEFHAATVEACLARAVEGFAAAFAEAHPSVEACGHPVVLTGTTPSALLLAVLEECLRRAREGEVAVGFGSATLDGDIVRGTVEVVPAAEPRVHASLPHVLSWHEVSLDPDADGWHGRVVAR